MVAENANEKTRNWTFLVYPDSAPENWREILDEEAVPWLESPFHEFDLNADGTPKKPHWHVILIFDGPKTYSRVCKMIAPLNGPIPKMVQSLKGMTRYLAHLDNPEKYQYDFNLVVAHGGVDIKDCLKPTSGEKMQMIREMQIFCEENHIIEFCDLCDYAREEHFDDWFYSLINDSTYFMSQYLKSRRYKFQPQQR